MAENFYTSNNNVTLVAISDANGSTPVYIWAEPTTHRLLVDASITSGVQTDGLTDTELRATAVPVSGTVNLGATDNAVLDAIKDVLDIINAKDVASGTDFDHIDGQQTSATVDTYVYKTGGSGGTTVQTVVVTYTNSAKTDVDTVAYS